MNNNVPRTLHVFNPSHDEALAAASPYYYPTVIARRLRCEWGALPALWAREGDAVWVESDADVPEAGRWCAGVEFVSKRQMVRPSFWKGVERIMPWGWDAVVAQQLRRLGAPEHLLPTAEAIAHTRRLSSRATTTLLLPHLRKALDESGCTGLATVGRSRVAASLEEVLQAQGEWGGEAVVKSLWSCSGRGVFRIAGTPTANDRGRIARLIREQGGVEVEPAYRTVADFALEFCAHADGTVTYEGLSLFATNASGGYCGNIIAPQPALARRLHALGGPSEKGLERLAAVCCRELGTAIDGYHVGPLGIDMMLVGTGDGAERTPLLHPCIEVNLRRTMGHVALCVARRGINPDELPARFKDICYFCPSTTNTD